MINTDSVSAYEKHVADLQSRLGRDEALRLAIGGDFVPTGKLEYYLLRSLGLSDGHFVIDVGCGSGRLACQLAPFPGIRYLGTDVVAVLIKYASDLCRRMDFDFQRTSGTNIPAPDSSADFACFFSVFTHLLHEDTFRYFREAARVLKPGGKMVMSFLEFRLELHWEVFVASVDHATQGQHLNQFIDRDAIHSWARHSGFAVESIRDGNTAHIPIPEEIAFDNGVRYQEVGTFGQSVAVLVRQ